MAALPAESTITESSCIPGNLLKDLYGDGISLKKDTGQRQTQGCGCTVSKDVGSYHRQSCFHNCLFCYANPAPPQRPRAKENRGAAISIIPLPHHDTGYDV